MGEVNRSEFKLTDSIDKLVGVLEYLGIKYRFRVHEYRCEDFETRLLNETILEWDEYGPDKYRYEIHDGECIGPDGILMDLSAGEHVIFIEHRIPEVLEFYGTITDDEAIARILNYDYSNRISKWHRLMIDNLGLGDKSELCFDYIVLERIKNIREYGGKIENVRQ